MLVITNDLIILLGSNKLLHFCSKAEIELGFLSFILLCFFFSLQLWNMNHRLEKISGVSFYPKECRDICIERHPLGNTLGQIKALIFYYSHPVHVHVNVIAVPYHQCCNGFFTYQNVQQSHLVSLPFHLTHMGMVNCKLRKEREIFITALCLTCLILIYGMEIMFNWKKKELLLEHLFSMINKKITSTAILSITNTSIINRNTAVSCYLCFYLGSVV